MNVRSRLLILQLLFLAAVCWFLFFFGLGAFGLVGADEPRYAQIAREMFQRDDWIVPTLNGVPWLEKPVLLYWKIINSYTVFGVHDWAARVPSAFHATALVVVILFFMRRFRQGSELDAALIAASSAAIIGFARGASTDMSLTADFAMSLMAWWAWHSTGKKIWLAVSFALLAFATLAKGPVAPVLALLIVGAYAWSRRDGRILLRSLWAPGVLLFFVLALPWYIAVQIKVPQFFRVFFLEHNLERFGSNLYQHSQPFWYYVPVFLLATVPWTVFSVPALIEAARSAWKSVREKNELLPPERNIEESNAVPEPGPGDALPIFFLLWTVIPIIFFSISRSKLPGYILPSIPASALLTADYLQQRKTVGRVHLMLHSLLCGVVMTGAMLAPWIILKQPILGPTSTIIAVTTGIIAILVALIVRRGGVRVLHFATLIPIVLALAFLLRPAALAIDRAISARIVNAEMREMGIGKIPVAVFHVRRDVAYGLNFYRNQPVSYYEPDGPRDLPSGVPDGEHVVVARQGSAAEIEARVGPRHVTRLGELVPQHLEFFLVSNSNNGLRPSETSPGVLGSEAVNEPARK